MRHCWPCEQGQKIGNGHMLLQLTKEKQLGYWTVMLILGNNWKQIIKLMISKYLKEKESYSLLLVWLKSQIHRQTVSSFQQDDSSHENLDDRKVGWINRCLCDQREGFFKRKKSPKLNLVLFSVFINDLYGVYIMFIKFTERFRLWWGELIEKVLKDNWCLE